MSTSVYRKPQFVTRNIGNKTLVGAGQIRIALNKDHLTSEHRVNVAVSQGFAVAPTAMVGLARMISSVVLESDKGPLVNADGESLIALSAFTENQKNERVTVGTTSTGNIIFDIHHENDEALQDLLSALDTGDFSGLDLVINLADPVAVGIYTGGTTPTAPTFNVRVNAKTYPTLTGVGKVDAFESVDQETGEAVTEANELQGIGTAFHRIGTQTQKGTTTGDQQPIRLQAKAALVRFIQLLSLDTSGANPAVNDNIIEEVRLVVNGDQVYQATYAEIQAENEGKRSVNRLNSGLAVIDYGDDEVSFLELGEGNEALLYLRIAATAPASWEIRLTEDYTTEQ